MTDSNTPVFSETPARKYVSDICKTTFTVTVLYEKEGPPVGSMSLESILEQINDGDMIGTYEENETVDVPDSKVRDELLAVANDGEFFALTEAGEAELDDL